MGTNYDSPDNLQFNAGDIIFISFIFKITAKFFVLIKKNKTGNLNTRSIFKLHLNKL